MIWHTAPLHEVLSSLHTDRHVGLPPDLQSSQTGAKKKSPSLMRAAWQTLRDPAHIAALIAVSVSLAAAIYDTILHGSGDWLSPMLLCVIVAAHTLLCALPVWLHARLDAQADRFTAYTARVRRGRQTEELPSEAVMPGDILELRRGDIVAADCRLIESRALYCDESAVDGPAHTAEKRSDIQLPVSTPFAQRINMVYAGSSILHGEGLAVAVQTGEDTRLAQLRHTLAGAHKARQDGVGMALLLRYSAIAAAVLCAAVAVAGVLRHLGIPAMLFTAAAIVFAAVPCGLSAVTAWVRYATALRCKAEGTVLCPSHSMAKTTAVSLLCIDRTEAGKTHPTLAALANAQGVAAIGDTLPKPLQYLLQLAVMSTLETDSTDAADSSIRSAGAAHGADFEALQLAYPREAVLPYSAHARYTAAVHLINGCHTLVLRGDVSLLQLCDIPSSSKSALADVIRVMQQKGLRVQAVVCRMLKQVPAQLSAADCEAPCFVAGLLGLRETPCADDRPAAALAERLGVRTVIFSDALPDARDGKILDTVTDLPEEWLACPKWRNVSSEGRARLIAGWRRAGHTVAVCGNSIADLPAMHAADVAFAAAQGSDAAARQAAHALLPDTCDAAVRCIATCRSALADERGGTIYHLFCGYGIALAAVLCTVFSAPISPVYLLLTPTLALALHAVAVTCGPQNRRIAHGGNRWLPTAVGAVAFPLAALLGAITGPLTAGIATATGAVLCGLLLRDEGAFRLPSPGKHPLLYLAGAAALAVTAAPLYMTPFGSPAALCALGAGVLPVLICEGVKLFLSRRKSKEV